MKGRLQSGIAAGLQAAFQRGRDRAFTLDTWLSSPLSLPYRHLWLGKTEHGFASVVVPSGIKRAAGLAAAADIPGVTLVDKAGSVSRVLAGYRLDFSLGLAVAVVLVWAVLARRYGWRHGAAVLLPALLGMALALAATGYTHTPVTLFSVMALLLVLCIGGNYAVFLVEGRGREGMTLIAVALSAATTLLSFGLLAFSSLPALSHFGATLLCGIAGAVLFSPLALLLRGSKQPAA